MDELEILIAKMTTLNLITSMEYSIEELHRSPRPEKAKKYISGMTNHIKHLREVHHTICKLEENLKMANKLHWASYRDNMELRHKIEKQQTEINDLKKFL